MTKQAMERKQDLRHFEDWFGVAGDGYKNRKDAERRKATVDAELKGSTGMVSYESTVKERIGYSGLWVCVKRTIDYNHPDRIAKGL